MIFFNKHRCSVCKDDKAVRSCPRKGKKICWQCCNSMRFDKKCPPTCAYHVEEKGYLQYAAKSDSVHERNDLLLRLFEIWCMTRNVDFNNLSPKELARTEEGRAKLENFFKNARFLNTFPINKARERLSLPPIDIKQSFDVESFAEELMNYMVEGEWEKIFSYYYKPTLLNEARSLKKMIKRNKGFVAFRKLKNFSLISSSYTKDGKEALIHFDINRRAEMTLDLINIEGEWKLKARFLGDPQLFYGEDTAIENLAALITNKNLQEAYNHCKRYSKIYPDSAVLEYYLGLYFVLIENIREARRHFMISRTLDPDFVEPLYNLGFILQVEQKFEEAEKIYKQVLEKQPNEVKSLNNLATICIASKKWREALAYLEKCVEIAPDYEIGQKNIEIVRKQVTLLDNGLLEETES